MSEARLRIRPGGPEDEAAVLAMTARLADFPVPPWRTSDEIVHADDQLLREQLYAPRVDRVLLVAEFAVADAKGMVMVSTRIDYFTQHPIAHIEDLAVAADAERQGIASALMSAAEEWARARGVTRMGLTVWEGNARARRFYDTNGYRAETIHYLKEL